MSAGALEHNGRMQRTVRLLDVKRVQKAKAFSLVAVVVREGSYTTLKRDGAVNLPHFRRLGTSCC